MSQAQILIVEDEGLVALALQKKLESLGYRVAGRVDNGKEAIAKAHEWQPDLILMDIMLIGTMDGITAAAHIQAELGTPIIYLSAYSDNDTLQRAKITQPFGYLLKPFEEKELQTTIEMALYKHKMERELKVQRRWLATTLNSIGDAVIATDDQAKIVFMNPMAETLTGWTHNTAMGKPLADVFQTVHQEENDQKTENTISMVLNEESTSSLSTQSILLSKSGRQIPLDNNVSPLRNESGQVSGAVLVFQDISERKQIETELQDYCEHLEEMVVTRTDQFQDTNQKLEQIISKLKQAQETALESEERLRSTIASMNDLVFVLDEEGIFLDYYQPSDKAGLLKLSEQFLGKSYRDILPPDVTAQFEETIKKVVATNKVHQFDYAVEVDGVEEWANAKVSMRKDGNGNFAGVTAVSRDITDRKKAEDKLSLQAQELSRSNADLEQFAYVASHDLREPLRKIKSYTELLESRYKGQLDERADKYIYYIVDGATRLQTLVTDLLLYSRVGRTIEATLEQTDMGQILAYVLSDLEVAIKESKAVITYDKLPTLEADPNQMTQLLQNLLGNAIKFHGETPPKVYISAEQKKEEWVFTIQDNGIGIEPKFVERIFLIFQRLHGRAEYAGNGIGLAICKKIIENHNGRIWIESEIGKGTVFYFTLPM